MTSRPALASSSKATRAALIGLLIAVGASAASGQEKLHPDGWKSPSLYVSVDAMAPPPSFKFDVMTGSVFIERERRSYLGREKDDSWTQETDRPEPQDCGSRMDGAITLGTYCNFQGLGVVDTVDLFLLTAFLLTACGLVIGLPILITYWLIKRAAQCRAKAKRAPAEPYDHAHRVRGH